MEITTTRFGTITVEADALWTFPRGLIGTPDYLYETLGLSAPQLAESVVVELEPSKR